MQNPAGANTVSLKRDGLGTTSLSVFNCLDRRDEPQLCLNRVSGLAARALATNAVFGDFETDLQR